MSVRWWVKVSVGLWVCLWGLYSPTVAHSTHRDPHLDPEAYKSLQTNPRDQSTLDEIEKRDDLSNHLALQVDGGERRAIEIAHKYGLHYIDQVFDNPDIYHMHRPKPSLTDNRPRRALVDSALVDELAKEPGVDWVTQQIALVRDKRRIPKYEIDSKQHQIRSFQQKERAKKHFHRIPAEIQKSRRALSETLQRTRNEARRGVSNLPRTNSRNIIDYWQEEESEDSSLDHLGTINHISPTENQNQANKHNRHHHQTASLNLIRVPLSRNVGYGLERVKTNLRTPLQKSHKTYRRFFNSVSEGREYIPRYRQLKDNIKTASNDNGSDEEGEEEEEEIPSNESLSAEKEDDFGKWIDHLVETSMNFNDPLYNDQWYLHNTGQLGHIGHDLNVTWAWQKGYTGRGITLSVLDDGLQTTNADIANNYEPSVSYSVIRDGGARNDPSPRLDATFSNSHGTYCAAIIAGVSNNSVCGVGVAYNSKIGGVRIVDGTVTDIQEATALSRHINQVDIFSASWGPTDDGRKVEGPGKLAQHALNEGVTKGRDGKGVVYVWASGNGGLNNDNCNLDGYTSSIYTLSVSALTGTGTSTFYEESCASTLAAVYVGGEHTLDAALERKTRHAKELRVVVPELDGHCSETFQGTSAAAPLMAGLLALVLQANNNLTWRDVQHLVVETSSPTPQALEEPGWQTNGRGKRFHLMQGFGAVNGGKMVEKALNWKNVKPQKTIILPMFEGYRDFHPFQWSNVTHLLDASEVPSSDVMTTVEHVVANITVSHPKRKFLTIFIVSPSGTTSQVLTHRKSDTSSAGFNSWGFMSVHFWGEDPQGSWKVALKDDSGVKGYLKKVEMTIYGS